jgi:UDP-N-acetylglucosamine--dolichyl-phosphate N-acetylglucosaminephosphotransferase
MPSLLRPWFGGAVDLGYFYYLCVSVMGVFCTNAINILSGVNGLEAGQSVFLRSFSFLLIEDHPSM